MNIKQILPLASIHPGQFRESESATCPDCEIMVRLQLLIADLLRKNQMLRMELEQVRNRISVAGQS